jgi:hypothetical protein
MDLKAAIKSTIVTGTIVAVTIGCGGGTCKCGVTNIPVDTEPANRQLCLSNMKQIGLAMAQYIQDYDEQFPQPLNGAPVGWAGKVAPYFHERSEVLTCPDDHTGRGGASAPDATPVSYALNSNTKSFLSTGGPLSLSQVMAPDRTVEFFEGSGDIVQTSLMDEGSNNDAAKPPSGFRSAAGDGLGIGPEYGFSGSGASPLRYATGPMGGRTQIVDPPRHLAGTSNYVAMDGHATRAFPTQVSSGTNNPDSNGAQDNPSGSAAGSNIDQYKFTFSIQ